jgi:polyhydroxyalkanoate synthesis regulator phasin
MTALAFSVLLSGTVQAGTHDPRINHRQHNQHLRIANGVKSGELTKDETKDLVSDQKEIHAEEKNFKSDGDLTKDERKKLHQDQVAASKEIYQEKHDEQERLRSK